MGVDPSHDTLDHSNIESDCAQYLMEDDEQLIFWVQRASPSLSTRCAWFVIYYRYQKKIMRQIKYKIYDNEDAEDVFQRVWCVAVEKLPTIFSYEGKNLGAWFYRVTQYQISKHIANKKRDRNIRSLLVTLQSFTNNHAYLNDDGDRETLIEAIARLKNPLQREVILLHYLQGLSITEISERLGKKANTIAQAHKRALAHIRSMLYIIDGDENVR